MNIILEANDNYTIGAYSDHEVKINETIYQHNLIVSPSHGVNRWDISSFEQLNEVWLAPLLETQPELIIIGHSTQGQFPHPLVYDFLSRQRVGLECMAIGAACRTYNVLVSEHRRVVLGLVYTGQI